MHNKGQINVCILVTEINIFLVVGYITKFLTLYRNGMKMERFSDVLEEMMA